MTDSPPPSGSSESPSSAGSGSAGSGSAGSGSAARAPKAGLPFLFAAMVAVAIGLFIVLSDDALREKPAGDEAGDHVANTGLAGSAALVGTAAPSNKASATPEPGAAAGKETTRVAMLVFQRTSAGQVLLEKPDHGGRSRPQLLGSAAPIKLAVAISNEGGEVFTHLTRLSVAPGGAVTFFDPGAQGVSALSSLAPVGTDQKLLDGFTLAKTPGRYVLLALLSRRPLVEADLAAPLAALRASAQAGKVRVPSFSTLAVGSEEISELRLELDLLAPGSSGSGRK